MPILRRRDKYRRYGSPQRLEFRQFGTPTRESDRDRDPESAFLSRRMVLMRGVAATSFAVIGGRLAYLQLGPHQSVNTGTADTTTVRKQVTKSPRGLITDRNGETLAENRKSFALAIVRSKLPTKPDRTLDQPRVDAMFDEIERFVALDWAITVTPLGPKALPQDVVALAQRLEKYSDFSAQQLADLIVRENEDPILLAKNFTRAEINGITGTPGLRSVLGDVPGIAFMRHAQWLSSRFSQPDPAKATIVRRNIPKQVALALDANPRDFPGLTVDETVLARFYPAGDLTAHIVGYIGNVTEKETQAKDPRTGEPFYAQDDLIGRIGVEAALEDDLRGRSGTRFYRVDNYEVERGTVQEIPAVIGSTLQLTIDLGLQRVMRDALIKQMAFAQSAARETDASYTVHSAAGIAIDPRNGELLALVSLPSFDPQLFITGTDGKAISALFKDDVRKPMLNKGVEDAYPPGSTLKPFFAAAGLQEGVLKLNTTYNCTNLIHIPHSGNETVTEPKPCWTYAHGISPHGPQTVVQAIMNSCDIFFYNVGPNHEIDPDTGKYVHYYEDPINYRRPIEFRGLGISLMDKYLQDFGFGSVTGIKDVFGETDGIVPSPTKKLEITKAFNPKQFPNGEPWTLGDTMNTTIGQGFFTCTPLQMAVATAAIANNGTIHRPKLVRKVVAEDGSVIRSADPTPIRQVLTQPEHLDVVRQGMRKVVTDGTAQGKLKDVNVAVAAKTGTAEFGPSLMSTVKGRPLIYQHQHAWFTAFAPYENPEIALAIFIYGGGEGTTYSAPVANEALAYYFGRTKKP